MGFIAIRYLAKWYQKHLTGSGHKCQVFHKVFAVLQEKPKTMWN